MAGRWTHSEEQLRPDPRFGNRTLARFINCIMTDGRKAAAERVVYHAMDEIVERLVYALVNEGAKILDEGIAAKAGDIDMVYLFGYGFPPFRGGPMRYADEVGLFNVVRAMRRHAAADVDNRQAGAWEPASLLAALAADGKTFT